MKLAVEIALLLLLSLVWINKIHCGKPLNTFEESKWTCICAAGKENQAFILPANCSTSCSCSQGGSSADRWICICAADGFPKVNSSNSNTNCFTACTCKFGTPAAEEAEYPKKQISREVVLAILILCVVFTVLVLVASVLCYFNRRDKYPIQRPLFLFDKELSINSSANLMSQVTSSAADYNDYITSSSDPCTGCINRVPFLSRNRTGLIHGTILQFSYSELESATKSFSRSNLIGIGGSSHVYRGYLKDGRNVAIKRIKMKGGADMESLFLTEIKLIARLHHCHVVPLLGYCSSHQGKNAERLLVFEYMSNGNLRDCLDGDSRKCLDWGTRIVIALGAAKGLEYLHESAAPKILHRDVKSTNILLNEKWTPKITDLGMAKHLLTEGTVSGSSSPARMQGTFGYFAPEYANVGRVSQKSDVFSFGVVLLELFTGRQPIFKSGTKGEEESLVIWATPRLQDSRRVIRDLPDPLLEGTYQDEEMQVMAYLAKECLLVDPDSRPTMSEVVQILSTIAPEKSRRNKMSLQSFQDLDPDEIKEIKQVPVEKQCTRYSSTNGVEEIKQVPVEKQCTPDSSPDGVEEIKQVPVEKQCTPDSSPDGVDCCHHHEKDVDEVDISSVCCMHCSSEDDETNDLSQPEFESFCDKF